MAMSSAGQQALSRPPPSVPMTPERRLLELRQLAADFATHLATAPGTVLPPRLRLGVALCARDALLRCKRGCHRALREEVCLRPGTSFYAYCGEMEHEPAFPVPPDAKVDADIEACLLNIVHAVVCHQNRLDEIWYKDAISAIRSCGILGDYARELNCGTDEKEMDFASRAIFSEIVLLAAMSHGIHCAFLALGSMVDGGVPPLPTWEEMKGAPGPSNVRFSSLLRRVRKNDPTAHAPYFFIWDVHKRSPEYAKIEQEAWKRLGLPINPWYCTNFAPNDMDMYYRCQTTFYLTPKELLLDWHSLNPSRRCSKVARVDLETVAETVAAGHKCGF